MDGENAAKQTATAASAQEYGLVFAMNSQRENIDGTTVSVKSRIRDVLEIAGEPERFLEMDVVKHVERRFGGSLDRAVPNKPIYPTEPQVLGVNLGYPSQVEPRAGHIFRSPPLRPSCQRADGQGPICRCVRIDFGLAI